MGHDPDIAQRRNKDTRIAWEQARQAAIGVGVAGAAFLPEITASALGGYQHIASPFPTNLVRQGYITANSQEICPEIAIKYLLVDFGGGRRRNRNQFVVAPLAQCHCKPGNNSHKG